MIIQGIWPLTVEYSTSTLTVDDEKIICAHTRIDKRLFSDSVGNLQVNAVEVYLLKVAADLSEGVVYPTTTLIDIAIASYL